MTKDEKEKVLLEERKVKALESISTSMEALTTWFEDIEKKEWSDRIQYYLNEFYKMGGIPKEPKKKNEKK